MGRRITTIMRTKEKKEEKDKHGTQKNCQTLFKKYKKRNKFIVKFL